MAKLVLVNLKSSVEGDCRCLWCVGIVQQCKRFCGARVITYHSLSLTISSILQTPQMGGFEAATLSVSEKVREENVSLMHGFV